MKRIIISGFMSLLSVSFAFSQSAKVVSAFNYLKEGSFEEAKEAIDQASKDEKTGMQAKTWFYRGAIYEALYGDTTYRKKHPEALTEAMVSYKKAMELDPKNQWKDDIKQGLINTAGYAYNEGVAPYNMKDYQTAYDRFMEAANTLQYLNTTYNLGVVDTYATMYAGHAALKMKKYDEATTLYQSLLSKNISRPELYSSLGEIYVMKGDTTMAKEVVAKGMKEYPNDKGLMIQELNLYLFSPDPQKSIEKLKAAIEKDPGFTQLYVQLGNMYDQIKDTTNARLTYEKAVAIDATSFDAYYRLGASYYNRAVDINNQMNKLDLNQQKQYDQLEIQRDALFKKALPFLERSHELDAKDRDTLNALKELYARLGMMEKSNEMKNQIAALEGQ